MSDRVCQDDCEAYTFGTPDEFVFEAMVEDLRLQYWAQEDVESVEKDRLEWSIGLNAWRVIDFALQRGWPLPPEALHYLSSVARLIDDWAALNGHPSELKNILALNGKRKCGNDQSDPRWIYDAISQLRERDQKASVKSLVQECMRQFPSVGTKAEDVRQKYYQGKKLAETGQDYKGRGRKKKLLAAPSMVGINDDPDLTF